MPNPEAVSKSTISCFFLQRMKEMQEFHERVELARELDEVKQNLAKEAEGRLILMSEQNWFALSEPTCEFLLAHNGRVVEQRRKAEIEATINIRAR